MRRRTPLSLLHVATVVVGMRRAWHASAAHCAEAKYDCGTCVHLVESDCYLDCSCAYCPSTGDCTASKIALCSGTEDEWVEKEASCPAPSPACSGKVCDEDRFVGGDMLNASAGSGLRAKACCAQHGTIAHSDGEAEATCSRPQDCSLTCGTHKCAHGVSCAPSNTQCQCAEGWYNDERHPEKMQCTLFCGQNARSNHGKCECDTNFYPTWRDPKLYGPGCTTFCNMAKTCSANGYCNENGFCNCTRPDAQSATWHEDTREWTNCSKVDSGRGGGASAGLGQDELGDNNSSVVGSVAASIFKVMLGIIAGGCFCACIGVCWAQRDGKQQLAAANIDLSTSFMARAQVATYGPAE